MNNAYNAQASDKAAPIRKKPTALPAISGCLEILSNKPFVAIPIPRPAPTAPKPIATPAPNWAKSEIVLTSALFFFFI